MLAANDSTVLTAEDGRDYDSLVANADRALYASKHRGKNVVTQSADG